MEKDILQEYGMEALSEDDEDDVDSDTEIERNDDELLNEMREQVEAEVKFSEQRADERNQSKAISFNIQNYITSLAEQPDGQMDIYEDALDDDQSDALPIEATHSNDTDALNQTADSISDLHISKVSPDFDGNVSSHGEDDGDVSSTGGDDGNVSSNGGDGDVLTELKSMTRLEQLKMAADILAETRTQRSYASSASTIAPSVITDRTKRTIIRREKEEKRKRCLAKGEASAVTRVRNENRDTVKQYAGWDF